MFNHIDATKLTGCQISGSIGEPWDFSSAAGEGRIEGVILEVSGDPNQEWLKVSILPFDGKTATISEVIGVGRYRRGKNLIMELCSGASAGVNLFYKTNGGAIQYADIEKDSTGSGEISFLVGSLKIMLE